MATWATETNKGGYPDAPWVSFKASWPSMFFGVDMIYQHKLAMVVFFTGMGMLLGSILIIAAFIR